MRLPHFILELEFQLENGVLLRERLSAALPFEYRGQVVLAVLVVLRPELKERFNLMRREKERQNLD